MQQISFPYVRELAVKFLSFYDCTFTVSITLSLKSRAETIHLLNYLKTYSRTYLYFFFYVSFLSRTFTNHRTAGEGKGISLTPHYHFHPLHRHLDISWAITAESSLLHIASCERNSLTTRIHTYLYHKPILRYYLLTI